MLNKESLYIQILLWTYDKSVNGFSETELLTKFDLDNPEGRYWYSKVFREHTLLIDNIYNTGKWTLTAEGMSAAVNYLNLKEAQESGKQAKIIAFWSIGIGVIVGLAQIGLSLFQILSSQ